MESARGQAAGSVRVGGKRLPRAAGANRFGRLLHQTMTKQAFQQKTTT